MLSSCKPINEVSFFIKDLLSQFKIPIVGDSEEGGCLRYIIVRYSFHADRLMVVLVTSSKKVRGLNKLLECLQSEWGSKTVAIVQNINDDAGNVLLGEANRFLMKRGDLTEKLGAFRIGVGPLSFLQVNSRMATKLYKRVQSLIGKGPFEKGLDLYSGIGLMGMHQSKSTESILCVEEVGPAALDGVTAARRAKVPNVLHLCADALEGIQSFQKEWGSPDWVILNPPRKGCEAEVLQKVSEKSPKRIVYVSCNPETLARDTALLMEYGSYRIKTIEPFDMFPQTAHVETILCLERVKKSKQGSSLKKTGKKVTRRTGRKKRSKTLH